MLPLRIKCNLDSISVRSPGKLIISGEHAVVYGKPALAIAVNNYFTTNITTTSDSKITFDLMGLASRQTIDLNSLVILAANLRQKYAAYLAGNISISEVCQQPVELLQFAVITMLQQQSRILEHGLDIKITSEIPIGCGMGSSAAAIMSLLHALGNLLAIDLNNKQYLKLATEIENLQHGKSSGLDLHLIANGGCALFQNGEAKLRNFPLQSMQIINTGKPLSTTGECVSKVATIFKAQPSLADEFAAVTLAIDTAIAINDIKAMQMGIIQNQKLLEHIGVVPAKVMHLIRDIEAAGGAAKVCGAGAISGNAAGIVLLISEASIEDVVSKHGYQIETVQIDLRGTQIV